MQAPWRKLREHGDFTWKIWWFNHHTRKNMMISFHWQKTYKHWDLCFISLLLAKLVCLLCEFEDTSSGSKPTGPPAMLVCLFVHVCMYMFKNITGDISTAYVWIARVDPAIIRGVQAKLDENSNDVGCNYCSVVKTCYCKTKINPYGNFRILKWSYVSSI